VGNTELIENEEGWKLKVTNRKHQSIHNPF